MTFTAVLDALAAWVWDASWRAAVVVAVVLLARQIGGTRLPLAWRCGLWTLVAARLMLFVAPQAAWSLFTFIDRWTPAAVVQPAPPPRSVPPSSYSKITVGYGPIPLAAEPTPAAAVAHPSTRSNAFPPSHIVALVWIAGVLVLVTRTALARRNLNRRLDRGTVVRDAGLLTLLDQCRATMNVNRPVVLIETAAVAGPALTGICRPRVLLPPGLCARLDREQLRFVFLHEMAHLRRHDVLVEWLIALLTALHWFNPAVWLAAHLYRADRELSRDAMVLRATGRQEHRYYGNTLLRLLETLDPSQPGQHLAVAMLDGKRHFKRRISLIADLRSTPARITVIVLVILFAVIATLVLTNPKRVASTNPATAPTSDKTLVKPEDAMLQAQLERHLPAIDFDGQRLEDVFDFLRDVSGARIFVNWRALEAAGINKDLPISARMRDLRLSKAIDVILSDAGGGNVKLRYATDGGVITISTADDLPKPLVTTVYDIHDLAIPIVNYESDPDHPRGRSGGPATQPVPPPTSQAQLTTGLIKLVRETVDPESWTRHTSPASIQEREGQLVVTQDAENQRVVAQLLAQLRESRSLQITTSTRFVVFDPTDLLKDDPAFAPVFAVNNPPPDDKMKLAPVFLTPEQTARLLDLVAGEKDAVRAAPVMTTFNGQQAYIKIVTQRAYVADMTVIRDKQGNVKSYEPVVDTAESGLTVDVQGTVSADRKYVTLCLRPRLSKLLKMHVLPFPNTPADHPAGMDRPMIQNPELLRSEIGITVSVPDGQTLVLGGTQDAGLLAPDTPAFEAKPGRRLYILVTPRIVLAPTTGAIRPPTAKN